MPRVLVLHLLEDSCLEEVYLIQEELLVVLIARTSLGPLPVESLHFINLLRKLPYFLTMSHQLSILIVLLLVNLALYF